MIARRKKVIAGRFLCPPAEIHAIARRFNVIADRFLAINELEATCRFLERDDLALLR